MVAAKRLSFEFVETVEHELPSGFNFIRRCRNDAGHPEILRNTDPDAVFLNLRVFTEFVRRVVALTDFLQGIRPTGEPSPLPPHPQGDRRRLPHPPASDVGLIEVVPEEKVQHPVLRPGYAGPGSGSP